MLGVLGAYDFFRVLGFWGFAGNVTMCYAAAMHDASFKPNVNDWSHQNNTTLIINYHFQMIQRRWSVLELPASTVMPKPKTQNENKLKIKLFSSSTHTHPPTHTTDKCENVLNASKYGVCYRQRDK